MPLISGRKKKETVPRQNYAEADARNLSLVLFFVTVISVVGCHSCLTQPLFNYGLWAHVNYMIFWANRPISFGTGPFLALGTSRLPPSFNSRSPSSIGNLLLRLVKFMMKRWKSTEKSNVEGLKIDAQV